MQVEGGSMNVAIPLWQDAQTLSIAAWWPSGEAQQESSLGEITVQQIKVDPMVVARSQWENASYNIHRDPVKKKSFIPIVSPW